MPAMHCGGADLNYRLSGNPAGSCVVFSSSLGADLNLWKPQLAAFEPDFHVLRYDMRGHGKSSVPPGPYTIADFGEDVLRLLDGLKIDRAIFCGISMGAAIGQWLAAKTPKRISRVVLVSAAARVGTTDGWNQRIERVRKEGLPAMAEETMARWFTEDFRGKHRDQVDEVKHVVESTSPDGYIACCEAMRGMDHGEMVKQIAIPALILNGEFDSVASIADARLLNAAIHGSKVEILRAAHISNIEAAEEFNRAVLEFARGC